MSTSTTSGSATSGGSRSRGMRCGDDRFRGDHSRGLSFRGVRSRIGRGTVLASVVAIGLLGGLGAWRVSAVDSPTRSLIEPMEPIRILDTRLGVGLDGPFTSGVPRLLTLTGPIETTVAGTRWLVPTGATGVTLNVTVVDAEAAGFVSVRPAGVPGPPTASSLNVEAGVNLANFVQVSLPPPMATGGPGPLGGQIEIMFDAYGVAGPTAHILVDLVGSLERASARVVETSSMFGVPPGQTITEEFTCSGDIATSAGYELLDGTLTIERSQPTPPDARSWTITARNDHPTQEGNYNIWVLCLSR